jgi:alkaline phosphatase D
VDGETVLSPDVPSFRTYQPSDGLESFTIAFGGGARYVPENERMWNTIATHDPLAMLLLGDNVYHDDRNNRSRQRVHYYRRQLRPEFRNLTGSTPVYAVWDDHDFCGDDCGGGAGTATDPWRVPTWEVFRENWVNPYYGSGQDAPGSWFDFSIGPVDFFLLDSRYYRDRSIATPSMLGETHRDWLLERLQNSEAIFKVIASPVPMARGVKPGSNDPWDGFDEEREQIFSVLAANNINGVFMIAADRHRSDIWRITRSQGYDLYEFMSSRLTNLHVHELISDENMLFGYNDKQSFGLLHFDLSNREDPEVTYEIRSIDNESIHTFMLKRTDLGEYTPPLRTKEEALPAACTPYIDVLPGANGTITVLVDVFSVPRSLRPDGMVKVRSPNGTLLHSSAIPEKTASASGLVEFNIPVTDLPVGVYIVEAGYSDLQITRKVVAGE